LAEGAPLLLLLLVEIRAMPSPSMVGFPRANKFAPTPAVVNQLTHAVSTTKAGTGGALQGSWDVPSAHSIDRTSAQPSVADQFTAATTIQRVARGKEERDLVFSGTTVGELAAWKKQLSPSKAAPGRPADGVNAFEMRDAYALSPYGTGYSFVNNPHDQFGSNKGFNESKTSHLADPRPTAQMRVKSGYTGHVPKGRDHVGSTYRMHDNRGTAGKSMVPIPHRDPNPPTDEYNVKMKRNLTYFAGQSGVFQGRMAGGIGDGFDDMNATMSTVKIPSRVEKLMEHEDKKGPDGTIATATGTEADDKYLKGTGAQNPMSGYTGHVPRAKEVIGSTFYGPTIGTSHHGVMEHDPVGFVNPSSPNKFAECP